MQCRPFIPVSMLAISVLFVGSVHAEEPGVPHAKPPIGVFGALPHTRGDVMLSYRFHRNSEDGLMVGDERVDAAEVAALTSFAVIPLSADSDTHVFEVMWVPFEEITFVLGLPYVVKQMEQLQLSSGIVYRTSAQGFGDLDVSLLYRVFEDDWSRVHLNLGMSFPTGTINATDTSPANGDLLERLPYDMQLGSGTFDIRPGFTYNGFWSGNAWGTQIIGLLHAGTNSAGYTLGNAYQITAWLGRRWLPWLNTAFRLDWQQWSDPTGEDNLVALLFAGGTSEAVNSPAYVADLQGGRRLDALFSLDVYITGGALEGTRLAIEAGLPAYQSLDGPQLRTKWLLTAGLQYAF
jgi:hypothetical protein